MTESAPISAALPLVRAISRPRRMVRRLWRLMVSLLAIVGFVTVVRPFLFDLTPMASGSMSPTLQGDTNGGDWVLAEKLSFLFRSPRRWEIVEFNDLEGIRIMKRVAALPGETIAIENRRVQINGQLIEPPVGAASVKYFPYGNLMGGKPHPAGNGYYVLGDDSADSQDSRYDGSVTANRIRARAWLIVWPPSRMGWVR